MREKKYFRNCPKCTKLVGYAVKRNFDRANKKNAICISCANVENIPFTRNCPQCHEVMTYTDTRNRQTAEKQKRLCATCGLKNRRSYAGENNPFYGKNHSDEIVKFLTEKAINHKYTDAQKEQARTQLAKVSNKRPLYDIWLEKYGKEKADQKLIEFKKKQSINNSGKKNWMYGKPSPQGSGNGWSGWYKNWFFRSLKELSYMIKVLEYENIEWQSPDKRFYIEYLDFNNKPRTYIPDFIINKNIIIEIKPVKLHNTPKVLAKKYAAEDFCQKNNMTYEMIDPIMLTESEIKILYLNGEIKFLKKYEEKYKKRYL